MIVDATGRCSMRRRLADFPEPGRNIPEQSGNSPELAAMAVDVHDDFERHWCDGR